MTIKPWILLPIHNGNTKKQKVSHYNCIFWLIFIHESSLFSQLSQSIIQKWPLFFVSKELYFFGLTALDEIWQFFDLTVVYKPITKQKLGTFCLNPKHFLGCVLAFSLFHPLSSFPAVFVEKMKKDIKIKFISKNWWKKGKRG